MDYELDKLLDAFVRGESCETALIEELCAACASTPELTWEVLAIADQYHRRGRISADLNRVIRHAIEQPAVVREAAGFAGARPRDEMKPAAAVAPAPAVAPAAPSAAPESQPAPHGETPRPRQTLLHHRERRRRGSRWAAQWQSAAAIAMFLTVTASSARREAPTAASAPMSASPEESSAALAGASTPPQLQTLSLDSERYVIQPGVRRALIRVQRTGGSAGAISFTWWTSPSGAKSGADYWGRRAALAQLPDGVDALTLAVPILANPKRAHTELFYVAIGHTSSGAVIGAIRTSAVIIMPDR